MNSEISTNVPVQAGFRPWHFFVLASLLAATAAVLMAPQPTPEHLVLISATLAAAGLVGAAFHRTLLPLVVPTADLASEPLGRRSRAALEREKTLVLRSIKELEFDRAMGKVADDDFNEMVTRLRARALSLMKQLDQGTSYRDMIERDLAAKMGSVPIFTKYVKIVSDPILCACGTANDVDARFCKNCGKKLGGAA
ncbi:MAG TPA: zinc ribbon domain-containing protein [Vicinamibacterales bacterium]|nr:zinc ribbon domain-containing protein [Vicinamibacterales bacterium]